MLLQRGARAVYAIDVGYGILDYSLRADPRVIVMERTNIRYVTELPVVENATLPPTGAVIDVAFISLKLVLPPIKALLAPDAWVVALIKPQFEAGAHLVGKGGVVRDPKVRAGTIEAVLASAKAIGWGCAGLVRSPIIGPAGNVEFLAWFQPTIDIPFGTLIDTVELA